jgi:hypothetical protein
MPEPVYGTVVERFPSGVILSAAAPGGERGPRRAFPARWGRESKDLLFVRTATISHVQRNCCHPEPQARDPYGHHAAEANHHNANS